MKRGDLDLGMGRPISRRDFLHGMGALAAGACIPGRALAEQADAIERALGAHGAYPPALMGMRGAAPESYEVAHRLALGGQRDWGVAQEPDAELYDLVIVGGGVSGLATAHFHRKRNPNARILILDNNDDFGGHARRNEFQIGDRTVLGYGGSQTIVNPSYWPATAKSLLNDLGVDTKRFSAAYDHNFYRRHGLRSGIYFNRETYGVDRFVPYEIGKIYDYIPTAPSDLSAAEAVAQMPISEPARREMLRLLTTRKDHLPDYPASGENDYLQSISYRDFLTKHLDIHEPEVFAILQELTTDAGVGIEARPAMSAFTSDGLPGLNATSLGGWRGRLYRWWNDRQIEDEPYICHFPDGNASIARMLVRSLIPAVAKGSTMEDVVMARFDYNRLDEADSQVRLRLNSTAVHVEHDGPAQSAKRVGITYVRNGRTQRVWGRNCVFACYSAVIPYLCPELPTPQRKALAFQVKIPLIYTTVLLSNWHAWKKLGIGVAYAPDSYHKDAMLDFPVSMGGYQFSGGPDEPILVHMERVPTVPNRGLTPQEQHRASRYEMLSTSFETMERSIRGQLTGMLAEGGFDPVRDIQGITVNRWPHGYSYWYNPLFDPEHEDEDNYPHLKGRKPFGRITFANSDAGAWSMLEGAIVQAHRAAEEIDS